MKEATGTQGMKSKFYIFYYFYYSFYILMLLLLVNRFVEQMYSVL